MNFSVKNDLLNRSDTLVQKLYDTNTAFCEKNKHKTTKSKYKLIIFVMIAMFIQRLEQTGPSVTYTFVRTATFSSATNIDGIKAVGEVIKRHPKRRWDTPL